MIFKDIRPFEIEPFKGVDLNMLFRVEVLSGNMFGYGSSAADVALQWTANNPSPDKPTLIRLLDTYNVFTPTLLESASFKVELAKWFSAVVDDILESGEGSWATGVVRTYFSQPQPYGGGYQPPYPDPGAMSPPFGAVPYPFGPTPQPAGPVPQPFVRNPR